MILEFLATKIGRYVAVAVGLALCVGLFAYQQQSRGASKALAKVERNDARNVSKANSAAAASRSGAGGVRDPYVRND